MGVGSGEWGVGSGEWGVGSGETWNGFTRHSPLRRTLSPISFLSPCFGWGDVPFAWHPINPSSSPSDMLRP